MSVIMEFAIFPTDKGESVSSYVARVIKMIKESGFEYQLSSMGTSVETENMKDALSILEKANQILEKDCQRIYITAKFDIRKSEKGRIKQKLISLQNKLNEA